MATVPNTISGTGGFVWAVNGSDPVLEVTETGALIGAGAGTVGILVATTPADITVNGIVSATSVGLSFGAQGGTVTIGEYGVLRGTSNGIAADFLSTQALEVSNAGQVIGGTAIRTQTGDDTIFNSGTIRSASTSAIDTYSGNDKVTNSGEIFGNVLLGDGNDKFIARAGSTVTGVVNGGAGNDKYWIVDNSLTLVDDSGIDKIISTVSHTLGADFEKLTLKGGADLDGTGNALANVILGNSGANMLKGYGGDDVLKGGNGDDRLFGGGGNDRLIGGRGNDIYEGGSGDDTFVFATGFGQDRIRDFDATSGAEDIDLRGVASITSFSDLKNNHMTQVGANVVIDAGGGDVLTLVGVNIADLGAGDFLF